MCSLVFKLMKKRSTGPEKKDPTESEKEVHSDPKSLSHFKAREKKTRRGLHSLSCFQAHEKEVHWTSTRSFISKLVKKRPTGPLF